jgi:uncharacterized protein
MKKLSTVILTVVLAAAGGGLFHALGVPAGWLTGAMIAVAVGAMVRLPLRMPAPIANGALLLLGISMGAGVTPDTLRQAAAWPLSLLVLAASVTASITVCSFWFERVHGWDRATARFASIPGALPAVLAMAVGTSADLPRVALAQSLRLFTLVAVMPPLLQWLAVPSVQATTSTGTQGDLSGLLLLLGASAAAAGLLHRMRFPGGVLLGAMVASAVLHGAGPAASRSARRRFHRNRRRDRKQVLRRETLDAAGDAAAGAGMRRSGSCPFRPVCRHRFGISGTAHGADLAGLYTRWH